MSDGGIKFISAKGTFEGALDDLKVSNSLQFPRLTASLPLQLDVTRTVIAAQTDLKTQTTGNLEVTRGGTGSTAALTGSRLMRSVGQTIVEAAELKDGWVFIGSTGATPVAAQITGSASVIVTPAAGALTVDTQQPITTTADVVHNSLATAAALNVGGNAVITGTAVASNLSGTNTGDQTIAGTANQVIATTVGKTTTLSTPQSIATTSAVTFGDVTDSGLTASTWVCADAAKKLVSQTLSGTALQVICTGAAGSGATTLSLPQDIGTASAVAFGDVTDSGLTASTWVCANALKKLVTQTLSGTANQVVITGAAGSGATTLSLPQDIAATSAVTFGDVTDSGLTASTWVCANALKKLVTQTLSGTANQVVVTGAAGSGATTLSLPQSIASTSSPSFVAVDVSGGTITKGALVYTLPAGASDTLVSNVNTATLSSKALRDSTCYFADATLLKLIYLSTSSMGNFSYTIRPAATANRILALPDVDGNALVDADTTARTIASAWTLSAAPTLSSLTASRPLKLTAGQVVTATQIDLGSTSDVTGIASPLNLPQASSIGDGIVASGAQSFPSGVKTFTDATDSTSLTTGAVVVGGGLGVSLNITSLTHKTTGTTDSSSLTTGAMTTAGGLGVSKNITSLTHNTTGTTDSTSVSTGAMTTAGGLGVAKNITSLTQTTTGTTDSTSVSTGTIITAGGIGAAKNITSLTQKTTGTTDASSLTTGTLITAGGIGCAKTIYCTDFNCANVITQKQYFLEMRNTASQTITNGSIPGVTFAAAASSANWSPSFSTSSFTVPATGYYSISGSVYFATSNTTGMRYIAIWNGSTATIRYAQNCAPPVSGDGSYLNVSWIGLLTSGNQIGMVVYQTSGGSVNIGGSAGAADSMLAMHYLHA